jgi:hypothetical protein
VTGGCTSLCTPGHRGASAVARQWIHDQYRAQRLSHRPRRCADIAAVKADKKGNITLTKEQLAFQSKFDCPVEQPKDCPKTGSSSHKSESLKQSYRQECSLDKPEKGKHETKPEKPFDPSVIGSSKVRP